RPLWLVSGRVAAFRWSGIAGWTRRHCWTIVPTRDAMNHGMIMTTSPGRPESCFRTFAHPDFEPQRPADVAVIMPTVMRKTITDALRSVFRQDLSGRIQILIGIDQPGDDLGLIEQACADRPPHCCVQVIYPGYSSSVQHGGLHPSRDGGVLRCVLTYLANSRHV